MNFKGTQVALDMYNCLEEIIRDTKKVEAILLAATAHFKMDVVNTFFYPNPETDDYTFIVICKNGNVDMHIFPELGYAAADIFTAEDTANPEQLAIYIRKEFAPDKSKLTMLNRGDFGAINDMKPRRRKQMRPITRAKSALKKLVTVPKNKKS